MEQSGAESRQTVDQALTRQWSALRGWLGLPEVLAGLDSSSVLDGWTVRDLVAHLGRALVTLSRLRPEPGEPGRSLLVYVSGYAAAAPEVAEGTQALAEELGDGLLDGVDRLADEGLAALATIPDGTVAAPRGPIDRDEFVLTRLVELVVHADDLARSLPSLPAPAITDEALRLVAEALAAAYREKTGHAPPEASPGDWVRAATGRLPSTDPALPLL